MDSGSNIYTSSGFKSAQETTQNWYKMSHYSGADNQLWFIQFELARGCGEMVQHQCKAELSLGETNCVNCTISCINQDLDLIRFASEWHSSTFARSCFRYPVPPTLLSLAILWGCFYDSTAYSSNSSIRHVTYYREAEIRTSRCRGQVECLPLPIKFKFYSFLAICKFASEVSTLT